jgi:hypothetical protein
MKQIVQKNKTKILEISRWIILFAFLYVVGMFIPEGFDWEHYFSKGIVHPIWTPWTVTLLKFLSWPLVVAFTLFGLIYRSYQFNHSPIPMALAIVSLPTLWVLFMSNLDGLVLFGFVILPLGIPLVLLKPQLSAFAVLAKKSSLIAATIWGLISLIIWGLWPMNFMMALTPEWKVEWIQDITLFPWGIIIALPLMWFSRGDEDLLMAAGSFATPHLFPYHFILLMPALGRMKLPWMILTWIISWTPLSANWIGPIGWHMGNVLGLCLWLGIYFSKRDSSLKKPTDA